MASAFAKSMLLVAGAGGAALVLLRRSSSSPATAPLPASASPRPPPQAGTPQIQEVASDAAAVLNLAQQTKSFFDSLPTWGSSDGTPALSPDDPSSTFT